MHQSGLCTSLTRTFRTDLVQSAVLMPASTVRVLLLTSLQIQILHCCNVQRIQTSSPRPAVQKLCSLNHEVLQKQQFGLFHLHDFYFFMEHVKGDISKRYFMHRKDNPSNQVWMIVLYWSISKNYLFQAFPNPLFTLNSQAHASYIYLRNCCKYRNIVSTGLSRILNFVKDCTILSSSFHVLLSHPSLQVQCQEADLLNDLNAFEEDQVVDDYVEEEVDAVRFRLILDLKDHYNF